MDHKTISDELRSTLTLGENSFFTSSAKIWNQAPQSIKDALTLSTAKKAIKTTARPCLSNRFNIYFNLDMFSFIKVVT